MLSDERDEDEDDTTRLSDLIALVEAGLQAEEAEEDTGRFSEHIAQADAGLQAIDRLGPQIKRRPLTIGDRHIRAMHVSLTT